MDGDASRPEVGAFAESGKLIATASLDRAGGEPASVTGAFDASEFASL